MNGTRPVAFGAGGMEGQVAVDGEGLQVVVAFGGDEADVIAGFVVGLDVDHQRLVVEGQRHVVLNGFTKGVPTVNFETDLALLVRVDKEVDPVAKTDVVHGGGKGEEKLVLALAGDGESFVGIGIVVVVIHSLFELVLIHVVHTDETTGRGHGDFLKEFGPILLFPSSKEQAESCQHSQNQ